MREIDRSSVLLERFPRRADERTRCVANVLRGRIARKRNETFRLMGGYRSRRGVTDTPSDELLILNMHGAYSSTEREEDLSLSLSLSPSRIFLQDPAGRQTGRYRARIRRTFPSIRRGLRGRKRGKGGGQKSIIKSGFPQRNLSFSLFFSRFAVDFHVSLSRG